MKNMNKKIIFTNRIPSQFEECREYVEKIIKEYYKELQLDSTIKIKFVKELKANEYEVTDCAVILRTEKLQELTITNYILNTIFYDGGNFFCVAIYHEMEHIKDYISMVRTKLFNFKLCLFKQKNFERTYVSSGYSFWTEIYAYYRTLEFAQLNDIKYEKIVFSDLVKIFVKLKENGKEIYNKEVVTPEEGRSHIKAVDSFVYLCAKFMASSYINHSKIPRTKISKDKDYKKVYSILAGFSPKIIRIMNNPYSEKSYKNLFLLGKYICEDVRWKIFKVGLIKKRDGVYSCC